MSDIVKYIRTLVGEFFLFPPGIKHSSAADWITRYYGAPVSAGFVESTDGTSLECHGRSASLRLRAADCDGEDLMTTLGLRQPAEHSERLANLQDALALALSLLSQLEPGDSRGVSDAFVAMAAVDANVETEATMQLIRDAIPHPPAITLTNPTVVTVEPIQPNDRTGL